MATRSKPSPPRPALEEMISRANEWFASLTPAQQREHREAQRRSWVVGELMLENGYTREQAEAAYDRASK